MSIVDIMKLAGDTPFHGGADPAAELIVETRPVTVRGEVIPVEWRLRRMPDGAEFLLESDGPDPMLLAREEYRRRRGWPTGADLAEWRNELPGGTALSQAELAAVLGFGIASLKRYEGGALPTDSHARVLADAMNGGIARMVFATGDAISVSKRAAFVKQAELASNPLPALAARLTRRAPDVYSGYRRFDFARFKAVVQRLVASPSPKTSLNKRLFYVDFRLFRDTGASMTGLCYARIQRGPVPDDYDALFGMLVSERVIAIEEVNHGGGVVEERVSCVAAPCDEILNAVDLQIIKGVLDDFGSFTAGALSDRSHLESAWIETEHAKTISYEHAHRLRPVIRR